MRIKELTTLLMDNDLTQAGLDPSLLSDKEFSLMGSLLRARMTIGFTEMIRETYREVLLLSGKGR